MSSRPSTAAFVAAAIVLLLPRIDARQQASEGFRFERPIQTTGAGPQKLRVDVPLLTAGQRFASIAGDGAGARASGGLGDLRIYGPGGAELPYLLITAPPQRRSWIAGTVLPIARTKTTSGLEVDLGRAQLIDALELDGLPPPFMKRARLEGSGDRVRWTVLVEQGTLFDLPQDRVSQLALDFTPGMYRYLRITWDDTSSAVLPLPGRASAREAAVEQAQPPLRTATLFERQASEPGRTRYRVRLPAAGLPIVALALEVRAADVFRTAIVLESRFSGARAEPAELGRARLTRTPHGSDAATPLRVAVDPPRGSELQLVIEDASNPSLDIQAVSVEFAQLPWIYFESPAAGTLQARYGNLGAVPPLYDLEARRAAVRLNGLPEATWGDPRPTSGAVASAPPTVPDRGARLDVTGFRHRRALSEAGEGLVSLPLDAPVLAHSRGQDGGFADVRIVDAEGYQIPYLLERRDEPLSVDLTVRPATPDEGSVLEALGTGNRSAYALTLPYGNLPGPRLILDTSGRVFRRPVRVGVRRRPDRQHRSPWLETLARSEWRHADQATAAEPLELALGPGDDTSLLLVVDEGDNRPLPITSARLLLPSWRVRFFKPRGSLWLVYGHDTATSPTYDLALLAPAVMRADARDISAAPETPGESAPHGQLSPFVFWIGIGAAAIVLLGLLARLVISGTGPPPAPPRP